MRVENINLNGLGSHPNLKPRCPRCGSEAKKIRYMGIEAVKCDTCGFDEREIYKQTPEERASQREKARHSPYRQGGKSRAHRTD